jgi:hypothetical protein
MVYLFLSINVNELINKKTLNIAIAIHAAILAPHYLGFEYLGSIRGAIWVSFTFLLLANFLHIAWLEWKKQKEIKPKQKL